MYVSSIGQQEEKCIMHRLKLDYGNAEIQLANFVCLLVFVFLVLFLLPESPNFRSLSSSSTVSKVRYLQITEHCYQQVFQATCRNTPDNQRNHQIQSLRRQRALRVSIPHTTELSMKPDGHPYTPIMDWIQRRHWTVLPGRYHWSMTQWEESSKD